MERYWKAAHCIAISVILTFTIVSGAYAAGAPAVAGLYADSESVELFVSGGPFDGLSASISGWECETGSALLEQTETVIRTLFLIDMSTSMREGTREQIGDLLNSMIELKEQNAQFGIAVFGEEYREVIEFTADRFDLAKAIGQLEWKDQSSSIYDAVRIAEQSIRENPPDVPTFTQLVVFSDGVENAEDGITKNELFFRLQGSHLPVHSIGFRYEANAEGIKELGAISRIANGISYEVSDADYQMTETAQKLAEYLDGVQIVRVILPEQVRDGAVRPLELFDQSGTGILQLDIPMPRSEPAQPAPEPASQPQTPPPPPEPVPEPEPPSTPSMTLIIILIGAGAVIAGVIIALKQKSKKTKGEAPADELSNETQFAGADENATMFLLGEEYKSGGGLFLILNDLAQPHKRFDVKVEHKVEIGREPSPPGISIDYDNRISRRHCTVTKRDGGLWIEDLGSANKTYVNDEILRASRMLRDGDVIACGKTKLSVKIERR